MTEVNGHVAECNTNLEQLIKAYPEEQILRFFRFKHLPESLQGISSSFADLAICVVGTTPRCAERTVALRKLLEGKDAAVRAAL